VRVSCSTGLTLDSFFSRLIGGLLVPAEMTSNPEVILNSW
jgi:hypothetical protein